MPLRTCLCASGATGHLVIKLQKQGDKANLQQQGNKANLQQQGNLISSFLRRKPTASYENGLRVSNKITFIAQ
jgi:hypothetical protein